MSLLRISAHHEPLIIDLKLFTSRSYNSIILCRLPPWRFLVIHMLTAGNITTGTWILDFLGLSNFSAKDGLTYTGYVSDTYYFIVALVLHYPEINACGRLSKVVCLTMLTIDLAIWSRRTGRRSGNWQGWRMVRPPRVAESKGLAKCRQNKYFKWKIWFCAKNVLHYWALPKINLVHNFVV